MSVLDSQYGDSGGRFGREQWRDFRGGGLSSSCKDLPDARQQAKVVYPLDEVLLALLATLAGSEAFTEIARFGERKLASLWRFRPFKDRTPPHDRIGDIFATLDAEQSRRCFCAWVASVTGIPEGVIAIDGKTVRRSSRKRDDNAPIHIVSAFAARQRLVLGQVKAAEESNEIIAIPKVLTMLAIEGVIVTIDAMGCQRDIAQKILDKRADYVLALKGNQGSLRADVELSATEQKTRDFADTKITRDTTVDAITAVSKPATEGVDTSGDHTPKAAGVMLLVQETTRIDTIVDAVGLVDLS